jgi:phosphoribosylaminoimidazolecarboxamide formyltransferase/IMP cyclohydrolase
VIRRALLSVTDKTGLAEFARRLSSLNIELVSTGGTARLLREAGLTVRDISDLTGFPEMLDGRVKTLHPRVHGGILHIRANPEHTRAVAEHGISPIDMVVVNLYAFEKTAAKQSVDFQELIENIDIGGPSMIRSAAKNFEDVAVVTSPEDYAGIAQELEDSRGELSLRTRWQLAQKAFALTSAYDSAIANTLEQITLDDHTFNRGPQQGFPAVLRLSLRKASDLRYGENPHQRAAMYSNGSRFGVANARQLQGKELSYNNIVDLDAAWNVAQEFASEQPFCAIIKHTNPCGAAVGASLRQAYSRALEADPVSAFGGVIGVNSAIDGDTAAEMAKLFVEAIAAPSFEPAARDIFASKKNLRLVEVAGSPEKTILKQVSGGMLAQDADLHSVAGGDLKIASERQPSEAELRALLFAWKICKHVKSNAIVYAKDGVTAGIGAGQMNRRDSARIAAIRAREAAEANSWPEPRTVGSAVASDAFFPFADGLLSAAEAGATAVIQPGGSIRDEEVIAAADEAGLAMLFTGMRHFRH